jgi:hypothetical protein
MPAFDGIDDTELGMIVDYLLELGIKFQLFSN